LRILVNPYEYLQFFANTCESWVQSGRLRINPWSLRVIRITGWSLTLVLSVYTLSIWTLPACRLKGSKKNSWIFRDIQWFSLISRDIQWYLLIFNYFQGYSGIFSDTIGFQGYSGLFGDIQWYSVIFRGMFRDFHGCSLIVTHFQGYSMIVSDTQRYSGVIKDIQGYSAIFSDIHGYSVIFNYRFEHEFDMAKRLFVYRNKCGVSKCPFSPLTFPLFRNGFLCFLVLFAKTIQG